VTGPVEVAVCPSSLAAAARVRVLRKQLGWSQYDLAAQAGLSRCMVSYLEAGRRNFTLPKLEMVAGALGTSVAALLGGDGR
jgi:transcriptional regulator with XRE-family HTH domain